MFRRDSCQFYVLRFLLLVLLFLYGMRWVVGRLFPYRRFLTLPPSPNAPLVPVKAARGEAPPGAFAKSPACAGAAGHFAPGRMPPPGAYQ